MRRRLFNVTQDTFTSTGLRGVSTRGPDDLCYHLRCIPTCNYGCPSVTESLGMDVNTRSGRGKSVSARAPPCTTPNALIQDSVEIFTRSFCRERLARSALLCQAAARLQREASQGHRPQSIPQTVMEGGIKEADSQ